LPPAPGEYCWQCAARTVTKMVPGQPGVVRVVRVPPDAVVPGALTRLVSRVVVQELEDLTAHAEQAAPMSDEAVAVVAQHRVQDAPVVFHLTDWPVLVRFPKALAAFRNRALLNPGL
jgi:hypothetical protein